MYKQFKDFKNTLLSQWLGTLHTLVSIATLINLLLGTPQAGVMELNN